MVIAEIIPEIYLGEWSDIRPESLKEKKISIVINVREEFFNKTRDPPHLTARQIRNKAHIMFKWHPILADPDTHLEEFQLEIMAGVYALNHIKFVNGDTPRHLAQKTLVFCGFGMYRSPLVVALHLYLSRKDEMQMEFYREARRPDGWINRDMGAMGIEVTFDRVCEYIQHRLKEAGRPPAQFFPKWYEGMI